jgi:hypothetical protein
MPGPRYPVPDTQTMRRALTSAIAVVAVACSAFAPEPTPIPTPTEFVIPTSSPKPSPTAFTGHYGFLVSGPNGYIVRAEGSDASLGVIDLVAGAVSPDGRLFAGWTRTTPAELRVIDVAKPAAFAKVLTLPTSERGGALAWAVDGTGIVYAAESAGVSNTPGLPQYSALRLVALNANGTANGAPKEVARVDALLLRPALWDRIGGDLVAALGIVPGSAREYVVVRGPSPPERRPLPEKTWQEAPAASGDARWFVIAATNEPLLRWFPSDDPSFILETHGDVQDTGASAIGRPQSPQIGVVVDRQLFLFDGSTGQRTRVPTEDLFGIVCFRFDGSAAVVKTASGLATLEMGTWKLTPVTGDIRFGVRLP